MIIRREQSVYFLDIDQNIDFEERVFAEVEYTPATNDSDDTGDLYLLSVEPVLPGVVWSGVFRLAIIKMIEGKIFEDSERFLH